MLRPEQNTSLRLQQRMAPQLIQSLRLLQMSTLDLTLEVKQQLELNPLLEEVVELREEGEEEGTCPSGKRGSRKRRNCRGHGGGRWDALLDDQFDAGRVQ